AFRLIGVNGINHRCQEKVPEYRHARFAVRVLGTQSHEPLTQIGDIDVEALEMRTQASDLPSEFHLVFTRQPAQSADERSGWFVARWQHGWCPGEGYPPFDRSPLTTPCRIKWLNVISRIR